MKNKLKLLISIIAISLMMVLGNKCYASGNNIVLNKPLTDDVNHTFKYPNISISNEVKPYSITLSIENGYFNTNNEELNSDVSTYFDFRGGTNIEDDYISTLNTTEKYKLITFNLKNSINLTDTTTKQNVIKSIRNFLSDILFYNSTNKDAKFTLIFSEAELKFSNVEKGINNIDVIVFKDPEQAKEHYYAKILSPYISWTNSYDIASELRWNGLQGYLVTITSEAEHNFIYQSLGSIRGWMGAASIENYDSITYNTKNIPWDNATDKLIIGAGHGSDSGNDVKIREYWRWVAGPEAGKKVFDGYNNFNGGEPNNYPSIGEWCGEYGHADGGLWNDYPNNASDIQGYYIEFGGFEDDNETIKPVTLVNTFKWTDYDFRNIEKNIEEEFEDIDIDEYVTDEELKEIIDSGIEKAGIDKTTYVIKNKKLNGNILSFDIEVTIGEGENKKTNTLHIDKEVEVEPVEPEEPPKEDPVIPTNPKTYDDMLLYVISSIISLLGISIGTNKLKKIKKFD